MAIRYFIDIYFPQTKQPSVKKAIKSGRIPPDMLQRGVPERTDMGMARQIYFYLMAAQPRTCPTPCIRDIHRRMYGNKSALV